MNMFKQFRLVDIAHDTGCFVAPVYAHVECGCVGRLSSIDISQVVGDDSVGRERHGGRCNKNS